VTAAADKATETHLAKLARERLLGERTPPNPHVHIVHPDPPAPLSEEEMSEIRHRLMADSLIVALSQVGVREMPVNSNRGPEVEKYLTAVGVGPGNAWCAAFTSWCIQQAGGTPGTDYPHTAWTPAIWSWAQGRGRDHWMHPDDVAAGVRTPPPGTLFLLYGRVGDVERVNHVGFVERVEGGTVWTVEGNTDASGSREGGGVYQRERAVKTIYRFVLYGLPA
jgi:hypothetical protein